MTFSSRLVCYPHLPVGHSLGLFVLSRRWFLAQARPSDESRCYGPQTNRSVKDESQYRNKVIVRDEVSKLRQPDAADVGDGVRLITAFLAIPGTGVAREINPFG